MLLIQLDETNVKLKTATEQEKSLLASLASLKAELKNTNTELSNWKKEAEESSAEMEEQLSQLQRDLDVALLGEDKARASITRLNDALHQVSEIVSLKFVSSKNLDIAEERLYEMILVFRCFNHIFRY